MYDLTDYITYCTKTINNQFNMIFPSQGFINDYT